MTKLEKAGPERYPYEGKIIQVVEQPMTNGEKEIIFELARRSPGVRLIIRKEDKFLLTKEHRYETGDFDYRLPGGKVFDKLVDYKEALSNGTNLLEVATQAALKECREETGLVAKVAEHLRTSKAGATVEWDLYYFIVNDFEENDQGQDLEHGEVIEPEWKSVDEIKQLISTSQMQEDRSIGVLVQYLLSEDLF